MPRLIDIFTGDIARFILSHFHLTVGRIDLYLNR